MAYTISYIEELCKVNNIEIPALTQLKKAKDNNDQESINRITENITNYLKANNINKAS